jgi:hypothetical protein
VEEYSYQAQFNIPWCYHSRILLGEGEGQLTEGGEQEERVFKVMITRITGYITRKTATEEILDILDNLLNTVCGDTGREFFCDQVNPL